MKNSRVIYEKIYLEWCNDNYSAYNCWNPIFAEIVAYKYKNVQNLAQGIMRTIIKTITNNLWNSDNEHVKYQLQ